MMLRIGIITNIEKDNGLASTKELVSGLTARGVKVALPLDIAVSVGLSEFGFEISELINDSNFIICLGGDGTFLKTARSVYSHKIPILGINLGSMGFLTEVEKEDIEKAIERIIAGDYTVEERMMLDAVIYHGGKVFRRECALNDVVISRGALSRILHVKAFINDEFIDMFPGDGLIVSTPTGSTAYSLSAGGPVVEPDTGIMIITPICPHILYSRSIIVSSDRTVKAVVAEGYMHDAMVTVDGQEGYKLRGGDSITIKKSNDFVRLVKMRQMSFFSLLRNKIYYRSGGWEKDEV